MKKLNFILTFLIITTFIFSYDKIDEKVKNLLSEMTIDEKIGQMTQIDRRFLNDKDIIKFGIGSILSGGGSVPEDNTIEGWANMYDSYQKLAQKLGSKFLLYMVLMQFMDTIM